MFHDGLVKGGEALVMESERFLMFRQNFSAVALECVAFLEVLAPLLAPYLGEPHTVHKQNWFESWSVPLGVLG